MDKYYFEELKRLDELLQELYPQIHNEIWAKIVEEKIEEVQNDKYKRTKRKK